MKDLLLFTAILGYSVSSQAQSTAIRYGSSTFENMNVTSFSIELEAVDEDLVSKRWSSYLKDMDGKVKSHKDEYFLDNTRIEGVSPDTLDIYSRVTDSGDNVIVTVAINKDGEYINNANGQYVAADDFLLRFAMKIRKEKAEKEFESAQKALKELEKSVDDLKDKNKKMDKNNEEMKNKISDNERSIKSNENTISDLNKKIRDQDEVVKTLKAKVKEFK